METIELPQELFDPAVIVQIYNSTGSTRYLARKFNVKTYTIARIKGGARHYQPIIEDYLRKTLMHLWRQQYGYDIISNYYPPPFGKQNKTPETIAEYIKKTG